MGTRRSLLLTLALGLMAGGLGAQTPQARLWDAAIAGDTAAIAVLLELGAPIDAVNYTGFTALHHAAENGSLQATKVLLVAGADLGLRTRDGQLAIDIAKERGHAEVAALLANPPKPKKP